MFVITTPMLAHLYSYRENMNRRKFIQLMAALGAIVLPRRRPCRRGAEHLKPDLEVLLSAVQDKVPVFAGPRTSVWSYKGLVTK